MTPKTTRRDFLRSAAAGAAAAAAPMIIPAAAFGANERITLGIIGPGGRGRSLMGEFRQLGAEFAAVAEIYEPNRKAGVEAAKKSGKAVAEYVDYRQMLEKHKDIDAVVIASPEHLHGTHLIDVVRSGRDSYCEKPMSHSIDEGNWMIREVRKTKQIVQIGMQRRSTASIRKAKEVKDTGVLGRVFFVRVKWNWSHLGGMKGFFNVNNEPLESPLDEKLWKMFCGPAGHVKFEPKKFRHWRWFWAFSGGNITDQGTHLMDVVQWFMGEEMKPAIPKTAECFGDVYNLKGVETPDVFTSIYEYPGFTASWSLNYTTSYQNSWSIEFMGDKGTMVVDDFGMRVYAEPWEPTADSSLVSKTAPTIVEKGGLESISHVKNFLDCVKSRQEPHAPVEIGHRAVCGPHLANVAYHAKERAYLSPDVKKVSTKGWWMFK